MPHCHQFINRPRRSCSSKSSRASKLSESASAMAVSSVDSGLFDHFASSAERRVHLRVAHTRTWHGTALCSNIIAHCRGSQWLLRVRSTPSSSETCSMKGTSMRSQLAAMFLVFSLSANAQTLSGAIDMHAHSDPDG